MGIRGRGRSWCQYAIAACDVELTHDCSQDVLSAATTLMGHYAASLSQYASHEQSIREHMKAVRTREENLDDLRRRRKNIYSKADSAEKKLSKMSPEVC